MANLHRGEIDAILDGQPLRLCLTLGALAELESTFGNDDMLAVAERFSRGRLSARDAVRIIGAGLRGAGHQVTDDAVARMRAEGGAAGFGASDDVAMAKAEPSPASPSVSREVDGSSGPFPGGT
jgi:hypothetical protein